MRKSTRASFAGYTIAEVMVSIIIMGVVSLGLTQVSILLQRITFDSQGKVEVAENIRTFTSNLSRDGRSSRQIILYREMPQAAADLANGMRLADGQSGDLAIFVHVIPESIDVARVSQRQRFFLERLIIYARVPDTDGAGPVLRYIRTFSHDAENFDPDDPSTGIEVTNDPDDNTLNNLFRDMLINENAAIEEVIELARGLADQRLFTNFRDNSLVVNGEIVQGNRARRVTNTYNFTISRQG